MTDSLLGIGDFWSSSLQQDESGHLYYTVHKGAGSLFSKTILYRIDKESNSSEKILSIRDSRSKLFIDEDLIYFTKPDSLLSIPYGYGSYSWYSLPLDQLNGEKNFLFSYDESRKNTCERTYIPTINGLYYFEEANNSASTLFRVEDGQGREVLRIEPSQYFWPSYTCMYVITRGTDTKDDDRLLYLWSFTTDSQVKIASDSRWTNAIIVEGSAYYEQFENASNITNLMRLDLKSNNVECLFQAPNIMNLAYDGGYLYVVTSDSILQFKNGEQTKSLPLPHEWGKQTEITVYNGDIYMSDDSWEKIYILNTVSESFESIPIP